MNVFRGQIWHFENGESKHDVFVCGVNDGWVWYTFIDMDHHNYRYYAEDRNWKKAKVQHFLKKYTFSHHAIAPRSYWKKKATGDIIQVTGIKDDGWSKIYIYYDLNKISLHDFVSYFEPCTKIETLMMIAREKQ